MKDKVLPVLLVLVLFVNRSIQQQLLCGDETTTSTGTPPGNHVQDPAACNLYLFCLRNSTAAPAGLIGVHQAACPEGRIFDEATKTCVTGTCGAPGSLCPTPATEPDINVADPTDTKCRRFRQCRLTNGAWHECPEGLVFNRNIGSCDLPERAPCTPENAPVECPQGANGFFPGASCYSFISCVNGEQTGTFRCSSGLKFDASLQMCVRDTGNVCVQTQWLLA